MLGVLPRTLRYMFSEIQSREAQENVHYSCFVSFMEIYNERIKDLLNPGNEKKLNILFLLQAILHRTHSRSIVPNGPPHRRGESDHRVRLVGRGGQSLRAGGTPEPPRGRHQHEFPIVSFSRHLHALHDMRGFLSFTASS